MMTEQQQSKFRKRKEARNLGIGLLVAGIIAELFLLWGTLHEIGLYTILVPVLHMGFGGVIYAGFLSLRKAYQK